MTMSGVVVRVTVVTWMVVLFAGCGVDLRTTTYDPIRACETFGGRYIHETGNCRSGGGP